MITSKLRQRLQELSTEYYTRIQVIETKVRALAEYAQGGSNLSFTTHGFSHISAVEQNYDWLIPYEDLKDFRASEIFCLICATFFHDILMVPRKIGDEKYARENHAKLAREFLFKQRDSIGLSIHEADAIAQIIYAHSVSNISEIQEKLVLGSETLDLRKLGACLALADISHADSSRAPEIVLKHLELDEDSRYHWRRHLQISGITREEDTILMSALTFSEQGEVAVQDYRTSIEQQLQIVKPYFDKVLRPIKRVELSSRRLDSPLDQTLHFQTNTPAILKLLIEGVYDREDVFVREIVQNALDACLMRRAKELRRNAEYSPQVLITLFYDYDLERYKAIRIDDNGIGMDLSDIQDTVLWIGSSISTKKDVLDLLEQTLGKNLIATFGIGLLSCFKASNRIIVRTRKENETPVEFALSGVSDTIKPEKSTDTSVGTTIIVELSDNIINELDPDSAILHYFRQVRQVDLRKLELEWSPDFTKLSRTDLFRMALTESEAIALRDYQRYSKGSTSIEISGDDFSGLIWIPSVDFEELLNNDGSIEILNEGIFVTSDETINWFPEYLFFCKGFLNFSSKGVTLPAGRDKVIHDEKFKKKFQELQEKSFKLIDILVETSKTGNENSRDYAALLLTYIYSNSTENARSRILKRLDEFCVRRFKRQDRLQLGNLLRSFEGVYIHYKAGRWVQDLAQIDGKQIYHKEDDFTELQAAIMAQEGNSVITAVRSDAIEVPILEADLIKAYFNSHRASLTDLTSDNVIQGKQRSRPVPSSVRQEVGSHVKFIEISGLPNKKAWKVGNELWINLGHPDMRNIYHHLQSNNIEQTDIKMAEILFALLSFNFDVALYEIISWFKKGDNLPF